MLAVHCGFNVCHNLSAARYLLSTQSMVKNHVIGKVKRIQGVEFGAQDAKGCARVCVCARVRVCARVCL